MHAGWFNMDVAIDSSSLFEMDERKADLLVDRILRQRARLVVPYPVLLETLDAERTKASHRLNVLRGIRERLPKRFLVSPDLSEFIEQECRTRLWSTPKYDARDAGALEDLLNNSDLDSNLDRLRPLIAARMNKDALYSHSREVLPRLRGNFSALNRNDALERLEKIRAEAVSPAFHPMVDLLQRKLSRPNLSVSMDRWPNRHRVAVLWCSFVWLIPMGLIFAGVRGEEHSGVLDGPRRGDWIDARVAACSAYSEILLTEDKPMTAKLLQVSRAFGYRIKAMNLEACISDVAQLSAANEGP